MNVSTARVDHHVGVTVAVLLFDVIVIACDRTSRRSASARSP